MKFTTYFLLPLALAAPVIVPAAVEKREAEALNILGLNLPVNLPGLNIPVGGSPNTGTGGSGGSGGTPTGPTKPIPTDQVNALLTPILENLGAPHSEVKAICNVINKLLTNGGLAPVGGLTNPLPNIVAGEFLNKVGTALKQILQAVAPGPATGGLVDQVIKTLQGLTQIKPSPNMPGWPAPTPSNAPPGIGNGLQTALNAVLAALATINPAMSNAQLNTLLNQITSELNKATSLIKLGSNGVAPDVLNGLLAQIFTKLTSVLAGLPVDKQSALLGSGLPLLNGLNGLIAAISTLQGIDKGLLNNLLGKLLAGLSPNSGALGGGLSKLLDGLLGGLLHL